MANMKNTRQTFSTNQMSPGTHVNGAKSKGGSQPPRNRIVVRAHMRTIATYSPRKKRRNGVDEYSIMWPATSSDSASTRSKGGRFVSASAEMKKTMNIGNSASQCQSRNVFGRPSRVPMPSRWDITISLRFSEPTVSSTVMMTKPIETSYETIWAAERNAPRNGYFEFDAQPPMITP